MSFFARARRVIPSVLIALLLTYLLNRSGFLLGIEHAILDAELRVHKPFASPVAVVSVTDADYDNIFGGRSPLDVNELRNLISDIAISEPLVIGVDIDTSHNQFKTLILDPHWPRVVWERDIYTPRDSSEKAIEPLDILGSQDPTLNRSSGIPILLDDREDKVTRGYMRCIDTKAGLLPSFPTAIMEAYSAAGKGSIPATPLQVDCGKASTEPMLIRFSEPAQNGRQSFSADEIRKISGPLEGGGQNKKIPELYHKIVLLGGSYRDFDRHDTPAGTLEGVDILANVVETQWHGDAIRLYPPWVLFAVDFIAAFAILILLHITSTTVKREIIFGLCLAAVSALLLSLVIFRSASRLAAFAPTLIAVILVEVYVHIREQSVLHAAKLRHPGD